MTNFVIADTHFGHKGIITLANRPFRDVEEMDRALIQNWNDVVTKNDVVWFLGDFSWYNDEKKIQEIFNSLNGAKHLITGNHDKNSRFLWWASTTDREDIGWFNSNIRVVLDHYPLQEWNNKMKGAIHLHGHVHANQEFAGMKNRWDVGVENEWMNYRPVDINWFLERRRK